MRIPTIAGIVLVCAGAFFAFRGGSFTTTDEVLKVGDLKVTAKESHPIAPWMAGVIVLGGVVLIAVGLRRTS